MLVVTIFILRMATFKGQGKVSKTKQLMRSKKAFLCVSAFRDAYVALPAPERKLHLSMVGVRERRTEIANGKERNKK